MSPTVVKKKILTPLRTLMLCYKQSCFVMKTLLDSAPVLVYGNSIVSYNMKK